MVALASALYAPEYRPLQITGVVSSPYGGKQGLLRSFAYCVAGTMGFVSPQALERSYSTSIVTVHYKTVGAEAKDQEAVALERTPAQALARVREVLKPAVLELGNLFGVSRQAVYDWQSGAQPAPHVADRLAVLARAADIFEEAGVTVDAKTLRRKVSGGGTVLDTVLSGGDAEQVVRSLVLTLQREAVQRERLNQQLAGRRRGKVSADDYGTPAVSEDA
jgi:transcriptional regulator with XRE-family HTH domain